MFFISYNLSITCFLGGPGKRRGKIPIYPLYGYHLPVGWSNQEIFAKYGDFLEGMYDFLVGPAPKKELWNQVAVFIHLILG